MPELPDVDVYVSVLRRKLSNATCAGLRLGNPFVLRSVDPPPLALQEQNAVDVRRVGKRIAIGFSNDHWLIIHLMIAGRLQWHETAPGLTAKNRVASLDFDNGSLLLTEAGSKKRAAVFLVSSTAAMAQHDPGGIEPLTCTSDAFAAALTASNHTLKRALTDPRILSGIGNAYSDEILHVARLSPFKQTQSLSDDELRRLYDASQSTLQIWRERLLAEAGDDMPKNVTAFRPDMRVHGKFGDPCVACGERIQRIRYKTNETNYCAACQTNGQIYKDRALSRLLKDSWPASLNEQL